MQKYHVFSYFADDELFAKAARLSNHVSHALLPPPSTASQRYDLRQRIHSLQLPEHSTHLSDCNFLMRKTDTSPTQFQPYTSLPHIVFTNTMFVYFVFCLLLFLYVWPTFCRAIIRRILMMMMIVTGGAYAPYATCMCTPLGCYIWYSEQGTGRGHSPLRPLLAVPDVTAHPSTTSVPVSVLLYRCCAVLVCLERVKNCRTQLSLA